MLKQIIDEYLLWMIEKGYAQGTWNTHERVLYRFLEFMRERRIPREEMFHPDILRDFQDNTGISSVSPLRMLKRYLFKYKGISLTSEVKRLPQIYEEYLTYDARVYKSTHDVLLCKRRVIKALHGYLTREKIPLHRIKIDHIDAFFADYTASYSPSTRRHYRSALKGFLRYLYYEKKYIKRNMASLVTGPPGYAEAKPPKFLRHEEVQDLFRHIDICSEKGLRAYAICSLAYTLGIRPKEISLIRLDDISFVRAEVIIRERKSSHPVKLPLPDETTKAIAAYIIGVRQKNAERHVFLSLRAPYAPLSAKAVCFIITDALHSAGIKGSSYWLRHTYAQHLLEAGASLFEIKQMLGHERLQSSKRYLHIHTTLMREVIFDETL